MNRTTKGEDGFSYVSYKRKRKKQTKQSAALIVTEDSYGVLQNLNAVMEDIQHELQQSDFIMHFKEDFLKVLSEWNSSQDSIDNISKVPNGLVAISMIDDNIDVVCYGLGQFSSCIIARYQLGFLLVLKCILHSIHVYVYDPQFSPEEINYLKKLGLIVLSVNEEGKRTLKGKSVCFLPHCDLPLYNNLLWANWNIKHLSELVIIGNSFQSYELNDAKRQLKQKAKYVYMSNKFVTEIRMANVFRFNDVFNDLSIHYFKISSLSLVDSCVWTDMEEPEYSDGDEIIKST